MLRIRTRLNTSERLVSDCQKKAAEPRWRVVGRSVLYTTLLAVTAAIWIGTKGQYSSWIPFCILVLVGVHWCFDSSIRRMMPENTSGVDVMAASEQGADLHPPTLYLHRIRKILRAKPCDVQAAPHRIDHGRIVDLETDNEGGFRLHCKVDAVTLCGETSPLDTPEDREYRLGPYSGDRSWSEDGETHVMYLFEHYQFTVRFGAVV